MTDAGPADLDGFRRWAIGDLVGNLGRGMFAEWLVGKALGVVDPAKPRTEWDTADLRYRGHLIEVKAGGRSQSWPQERPSAVRFDIARRQQSWDAVTNEWEPFDTPRRVAHVYVFCHHTPEEATNENVADPSQWEFWVVATTTLDTEFEDQKTIGTGRLNTIADPVNWGSLRNTVDQAIN